MLLFFICYKKKIYDVLPIFLFADLYWIKIKPSAGPQRDSFITKPRSDPPKASTFTAMSSFCSSIFAYLVKLDREDNVALVYLLRFCFENLCYSLVLETTGLIALVTSHSKHSSSPFTMFTTTFSLLMNSGSLM